MRSVWVLWLAVWVAGCSAAAVESVGTLANSIGSAATGYQTAQSTKKLNEANVEAALANAALTRQQASDLNTRQDEVERERPVVVRILNSAADSEHDPMLKNVALWVAAGGDPDYAFKYWLSHEETLSAPNSHPLLELPNQQPALQPKQPGPSPKQAPLTSVPEFPQASASGALPQALSSVRPPPTVTPAR
jgi:ATP/maltotriose-dependent transcriptional regulator MalT